MKTVSNAIGRLYVALACDPTLRSAVYYGSEKYTIKLTRQRRPRLRDRAETFVLTLGVPNYRERAFIKLLIKAGEKFPQRKIQFRFWPRSKTKNKGETK